jgi:hypothetical protein
MSMVSLGSIVAFCLLGLTLIINSSAWTDCRDVSDTMLLDQVAPTRRRRGGRLRKPVLVRLGVFQLMTKFSVATKFSCLLHSQGLASRELRPGRSVTRPQQAEHPTECRGKLPSTKCTRKMPFMFYTPWERQMSFMKDTLLNLLLHPKRQRHELR